MKNKNKQCLFMNILRSKKNKPSERTASIGESVQKGQYCLCNDNKRTIKLTPKFQ